jgi:hypothetical protein
MPAHGHTATWGTHIGAGHTMQAQRWYAQFKTLTGCKFCKCH